MVKWSSGKVVQWTSGPVDQWSKKCLQKVLFNSIKREARYHEFKLDVHRQTEIQRNRQTDLVLEVAPPEVGHLKKLKKYLELLQGQTQTDNQAHNL